VDTKILHLPALGGGAIIVGVASVPTRVLFLALRKRCAFQRLPCTSIVLLMEDWMVHLVSGVKVTLSLVVFNRFFMSQDFRNPVKFVKSLEMSWK